jgi:hypothetical protein
VINDKIKQMAINAGVLRNALIANKFTIEGAEECVAQLFRQNLIPGNQDWRL